MSMNGQEHAKGFSRKVDAQTWLVEITAAQLTNNYIDPEARTDHVQELLQGVEQPADFGFRALSER